MRGRRDVHGVCRFEEHRVPGPVRSRGGDLKTCADDDGAGSPLRCGEGQHHRGRLSGAGNHSGSAQELVEHLLGQAVEPPEHGVGHAVEQLHQRVAGVGGPVVRPGPACTRERSPTGRGRRCRFRPDATAGRARRSDLALRPGLQPRRSAHVPTTDCSSQSSPLSGIGTPLERQRVHPHEVMRPDRDIRAIARLTVAVEPERQMLERRLLAEDAFDLAGDL